MRKLLAGLGLSVALLVVVAPAAWAGGWAVSTLDPMSAPVAGVPTDIGFTIRQHGVTPVDLDDAAIVVTAPSGETTVFPAKGDGVEGHYVAIGDLRGRPIDVADPSRVLRAPGPRCDHRCCGHVQRSRAGRVVVVPVARCRPRARSPCCHRARDRRHHRRDREPSQEEPSVVSTAGIVAAIGAIALGVASIIGWGSTSSADQSGRNVAAPSSTARRCSGRRDARLVTTGPTLGRSIDGFPNLS